MGRWNQFASIVVVAAALAGVPALAEAQAGWYVTPSFTLTEEYDDNLFGVSKGKRSDFITRLTPGFGLGYSSEPFTLLGRYSLGVELFANNPDLNGVNRQLGELETRYLPTPPTTLRLDAKYRRLEATTLFSAEQVEPEIPVLDIGRRTVTLISVAPSVSHEFTPRTSGEAGYAFKRSDVERGSTDTAHQGRLRFARQLTPLDRGVLTYHLGVFESDRGEEVTSHAVTAGWGRQLTPATYLELEAGPRFSDGDVDPEVLARLRHRFRQATLTVAYARSQSIVVGRAGASTTERVSATLSMEPTRLLRVGLAASRLDVSGEEAGTRDVVFYGAGATATYALTRWLMLRGTYSFLLQEARETIRHHIVAISLEFGYPIRLY